MWLRTAIAFALSIFAAFCGWMIEGTKITTKTQIIEGIGTTMLFLGASMAIASFIEARKISILQRTLANEMEERKRKIQTLHRLEGTPIK